MPTRRARVADAARHDCSNVNPELILAETPFSDPRLQLSAQVALKKEFAVALALALVSGASALAHQIVWTRRFVDVLGANADTFSKVVGAFLAGLAVGAWIASQPSRTGMSFWRRVALAEVVVAVLSLPIISSPYIADWLSTLIGSRRVLKLLLPLCLVAPPAVAMGAVIP